ncbi:MAG: hypothetical protein KTR29_07655 [Rhodothermaceae bacterium]|nr:hypothetical protein [Rhodothermaceae bacterium]
MFLRRPLVLVLGLVLSISLFAEVVHAQSSNTQVLEDIRSAYDGLDYAIAETRINEALRDYERFLPQELSEIHVLYALVLFAQSKPSDAEAQLGLAVQLNPSLELDPLDTPPRLYAAFVEIKEGYSDNSSQVNTPQDVRYLLVYDPRANAALRSMVVPGWGQLYKGEKRKGIVLASLWGLTASGSLIAHVSRNQAQDHYRASETQAQTQSRFRAFSTWHKVRNNMMLAAAGIWVYSYIDAIVVGGPVEPGRLRDSDFKVSMIPVNGRAHLSVLWRF